MLNGRWPRHDPLAPALVIEPSILIFAEFSQLGDLLGTTYFGQVRTPSISKTIIGSEYADQNLPPFGSEVKLTSCENPWMAAPKDKTNKHKEKSLSCS